MIDSFHLLSHFQAPVFSGTPVTAETFAEWKVKFQAEMSSGKAQKEDPTKKKLTGRCPSWPGLLPGG